IISQKLNANVLTFLTILVHSGFIFDRHLERCIVDNWVIVIFHVYLMTLARRSKLKLSEKK
ncbi:MAG TPA: hypothetical protein VK553_03000, partial [Candidatus Nitrosopolaris rasttigaisensis]|nr:hypothetical protein [Candidatus Nitrosopolaris rasttigaisensis]